MFPKRPRQLLQQPMFFALGAPAATQPPLLLLLGEAQPKSTTWGKAPVSAWALRVRRFYGEGPKGLQDMFYALSAASVFV